MTDLPRGEQIAEWTTEEVRRDTARINAELAGLDDGTDPFAAMVRATRMPMIVTDPRVADNPVVFANDAFCRLSGYPREEIIGRNCRFLQGPGTDPATVARIRAAVAAIEPIEIDIRNYSKDGEPFWNRLLMAPVRDASGILAYFFASQLDVTNEHERVASLERHNAVLTAEMAGRLRAEAALRELNETLEQQVEQRIRAARLSEARFRGIFDSTYQLIGLIALDGTMLEVNRAALNAMGIDASGAVGLPAWDSSWFSRTPKAVAVLKAAFPASSSSKFIRTELDLLLPDGRVRTYDFSLSPVRDDQGRVVFIVAEGRDITDLRAMEEQLRQSQKMEAVGQLTGGIAHDFNNLLAGIIGSLELLQRRVATGRLDGLERYMSAAVTSAQRAAALTQRLLAFARRQPLDAKRVDANRLVAGMEDLLRRTLGPGIDLEMVLAGELWPILCDPNQLESAILNLAINARDAMPEGGRLTVETENAHLDDAYAQGQSGEVRSGKYVAVSVTDTGTGMTPDVIQKAFDPFFTTKPAGQGTGLGLSMLYGFVKQSEGNVRILSELGQGTTFQLYLPRFRGGADDHADEVANGADAALRAEAGETVLVVDDEATVRMLVTETLEELGYAAIEAVDGPSGLRILQSNARIDLLVTDVGLPGLNGRQLADAARVSRPELRVLFITGYAYNAAVASGAVLDPGMEMLTKPFALDALATKIRAMIESR